MRSQEIRKKFLNYFQEKGHKILPSSPVIPLDDPTLLFINAGMNQFKEIFLGNQKARTPRAVTSQKCIRAGGKHNDLENVGHTTRHLTFFEMLGNFSFGDYFKKEAIAYSWELATDVFKLEPEHIWASVYEDDDEAFELWKKHVPEKRIVRFGASENFWAMGDVGPCGPCSELLYDKGPKYGTADTPLADPSGERYFEFWNLVFMESERSASGKLTPLPKKNIDTGAGLERIVSLKQKVDNVFLTDILRGLIAEVENISGKKYEEKNAPPFHVIADHIRTLAFSIADGAQPSNTDRGYVLRKILRRAVRYGRELGLMKPFLGDLLPRLNAEMGADFPELFSAQKRIREILHAEEEAFIRTLQRGGNILANVIDVAKGKGSEISGDDAFKLKDTYGFPIEEILLIAKDENLGVDLKRFQDLEKEAKERSRKARAKTVQEFSQNLFVDFLKENPPTKFSYEETSLGAKIIACISDGAFVDVLEEGQEGMVLLDQTPFYAEMGGQVGDTGTIAKEGAHFHVTDTQSPYSGITAHYGAVEKGSFQVGDAIKASVETSLRREIMNNHTATHILHWALRKVLGEHIKQAGSLVEPARLRFDFNHHLSLTKKDLVQIETLVNEKIAENRPVESYEIPYEKAKNDASIIQFFGEKYGDTVRVIDIDFTKELCGGTHTSRTGNIGLFKIAKEGSIAKGVRRIEALTGLAALKFVHEEEEKIQIICDELKTPESKLLEKLENLLIEKDALSKKVKEMEKGALKSLEKRLLEEADGNPPVIAEMIDISPKDLASFADGLIQKLAGGAVILGVKEGDRCQIVVRLSKDLDFDAKTLIMEAAPLIKGGGGGKKNAAQAGGKDATKLSDALDKIRNLIQKT